MASLRRQSLKTTGIGMGLYYAADTLRRLRCDAIPKAALTDRRPDLPRERKGRRAIAVIEDAHRRVPRGSARARHAERMRVPVREAGGTGWRLREAPEP